MSGLTEILHVQVHIATAYIHGFLNQIMKSWQWIHLKETSPVSGALNVPGSYLESGYLDSFGELCIWLC